MSVPQPFKILLVEDNPELCEVWMELLNLDGHQVRVFLDGRSVLADAGTIPWCDVVITDYYLPDINGLELVGHIRQMRPGLPVILLSGMRDNTVIGAVRKMPNAAFLPKPADVDELEAALFRLTRLAAETDDGHTDQALEMSHLPARQLRDHQ